MRALGTNCKKHSVRYFWVTSLFDYEDWIMLLPQQKYRHFSYECLSMILSSITLKQRLTLTAYIYFLARCVSDGLTVGWLRRCVTAETIEVVAPQTVYRQSMNAQHSLVRNIARILGQIKALVGRSK